MPSRRENKRRMQLRLEHQERQRAASCIQELWRSRKNSSKIVAHVCLWQKVRTSPPPPPYSLPPPRSCLRSAERLRGPKAVRFTHGQRCAAQDDVFRAAMTCRICQDVADAPMFANCCDNAPAFGAVCFGCYYKFMQLDKVPNLRSAAVRSWSLTCQGTCTYNLFDATRTRTRALFLLDVGHVNNLFFDRLRDGLGPSSCFACREVFTTTAALRRHLRRRCKRVHVQCDECTFFGRREEMAQHRLDVHEYVKCPCCSAQVQTSLWKAHAQVHMDQLRWPQTTVSGAYNVSVCGKCVAN